MDTQNSSLQVALLLVMNADPEADRKDITYLNGNKKPLSISREVSLKALKESIKDRRALTDEERSSSHLQIWTWRLYYFHDGWNLD